MAPRKKQKAEQKQKKEKSRLNIHIDPELHHRFKMATTAQREDMTKPLLRFITEYVERYFPQAMRQEGRRK